MPTVDHKDQPAIAAPITATPVAQAPVALTPELEAAINAVLKSNHVAAVEAAKPKEPNWAALTEAQAMQADTYIPVIDHEIADYMNVRLKDPEYEAVWVHNSPRRIGQKMAEGFKPLTATDVDPNFTMPMQFNSEGIYQYEDTICMIVHKRILYGKRKKALQVSLNQLSNRNRPPRVRLKDSYDQTAPVPDQLSYGATLYSEII